MGEGKGRRPQACPIASSGGVPWQSLSPPGLPRRVHHSPRRWTSNAGVDVRTGRRIPIGLWPTRPAIVLMAPAVPPASVPVWIDSGSASPGQPSNGGGCPPLLAEPAPRCLQGSEATHAPNAVVGASLSRGPCVRSRMRNCCYKSARPWRRMRGPCGPSACDGDAQPRAAAASGGLGPASPRASCSIRTVLGLPAVCAWPRSTLPWWSQGVPGIPPPDRRHAGSQWPRASARPRGPRPGGAHAGRAPRYGAAPRLPVGAPLPCRRWALASGNSRPPRRRGWPSRCQPSAATRPAKWPSSAWIVRGKWLAETRQPLRMDSVAWAGVVRVGSRAAVARYPPAPMLPSAEAVRRHGASPCAGAARRALRPHRLGTTWGGRPAAAS
jgi:hypothetical protein